MFLSKMLYAASLSTNILFANKTFAGKYYGL